MLEHGQSNNIIERETPIDPMQTYVNTCIYTFAHMYYVHQQKN